MPDSVPATRFDQSPILELQFPPLPRTAAEVAHMLSERGELPDTPRLVEIVNQDPVVAASVLRRINSAYYGMRRRIGDIQKAIFLLGFLEVCNLILTASMLKLRDVLHTEAQERMFDQIMHVSVGAAHYAREIAVFLDLPARATAFSAGLMVTTGRLVLLYNKPHDYEALWCTTTDGFAPSAEEERVIFGTDHASLARLAGESWNLPPDIVTVIGSYLEPDQIQDRAVRALATTVRVGVNAVTQLDMTPNPMRKLVPPIQLYDLAELRGVEPDSLVDLIETSAPTAFEWFDESECA